MKKTVDLKNNQISFTLEKQIYPPEAVYSAAYVFVDRAFISLSGQAKSKMTVFLKGKQKMNQRALAELAGEFKNELLNYLLRVEIAKHSQNIREYIVGTALVSGLPGSLAPAGRQGKKVAAASWQDDPLGIAVPWENKHRAKKNRKKSRRS